MCLGHPLQMKKKIPQILFEDNHLLVVSKPAGWLSHGDKTGDLSVVDWAKSYLIKKYNKPGDAYLGLPHRIDRSRWGCAGAVQNQ